jgi:hypothetical protein
MRQSGGPPYRARGAGSAGTAIVALDWNEVSSASSRLRAGSPNRSSGQYRGRTTLAPSRAPIGSSSSFRQRRITPQYHLRRGSPLSVVADLNGLETPTPVGPYPSPHHVAASVAAIIRRIAGISAVAIAVGITPAAVGSGESETNAQS